MPNLKIEFKTDSDFNVIRIDDKRIVFDSDGLWERNLSPGIHVLTWNIKGNKGDTYSLEILSPNEAAWKRQATLDSFGLDFGLHEIEL